jgi:phosphatidylglycerol:prolipoprotein diacylglycerol transferase
VHPVALQFGAFTITWFGVMVASGFLAGFWTATRRAPRANISGETVMDFVPWLILGAVGGGRTLYVITYWREQFADAPWWEMFMVQHGGLVFYGGLIGASAACIVRCRIHRLPLWRVADVLAPSIAVGYVFGRIGCLLNGCCFGRLCELSWAVRYPVGHSTHPVNGTADAVHPVQIYDSLLNLLLFVTLEWLFCRRKFDGQIFALYLMGFALTRSIAEFFRGDYPLGQVHAGLTPGQVLSIGIFLAGTVLFILLRQRAVAKKT